MGFFTNGVVTSESTSPNVKPTFEKIGEGIDKSKEQFHQDKLKEAGESLQQAAEGKRGRGRPKGSTNAAKTMGDAQIAKPIDATLFISGTKIILNGISNIASKIIRKKAEKVVSENEAKEYGDDAKIIDEELEMTATQLGTLAAQSPFLALYGPYILAFGGIASWGMRVSALNSSLEKLIEKQKKEAKGPIAIPPSV